MFSPQMNSIITVAGCTQLMRPSCYDVILVQYVMLTTCHQCSARLSMRNKCNIDESFICLNEAELLHIRTLINYVTQMFIFCADVVDVMSARARLA